MSNIITYPTNPTQGQEFTVGQTIKVWDGEKWVNKSFGNHEVRLQGLEAHEASTTNPHAVTKAQVGLGSVDDVSAASLRDRSTHTGTQPLSTISDSGSAASKDVGVINGVASLDGSGKVPDSESQVSSVNGKKGDAILNAVDIDTGSGINTQQFIDNFELKIFQSPTDNLTKVSTFAGGVGVVYEVRKTSDNSLATIYSDKDGVTEIVQNGTSNISDANAEAVFYIADGDYTLHCGTLSASIYVVISKSYDEISDLRAGGIKHNGLRVFCKENRSTYTITNSPELIEGFAPSLMTQDDGFTFINLSNGYFAVLDHVTAVNYVKTEWPKLYANAMAKLRLKKSASLVCYGDSITFGQGTVGKADSIDRTGDPTNFGDGSLYQNWQLITPYPEYLQGYLRDIYGDASISVKNRGYSGDSAYQLVKRHITPPVADMGVVMIGINDCAYATNNHIDEDGIFNAAGYNLNDFTKALEVFLTREVMRGTALVLMTCESQASNAGFDGTVNSGNVLTEAYNDAIRSIGSKYGIPVIETIKDLFYGYPIYARVVSPGVEQAGLTHDGVHLDPYGAALLGARISSVFSGKGVEFNSKFPVYSGSKMIANYAQDSVNSPLAAMSTSPSSYAPFFLSQSEAQSISLTAGQTVYFSFYAANDGLIAYPCGKLSDGGVTTVTLNFGAEQPEYTLDYPSMQKIEGYGSESRPPSAFTLEGSASVQEFSSRGDLRRGLYLASKGWHTVAIFCAAGTTEVYGLQFTSQDTAYSDSKFAREYKLAGTLTNSTQADIYTSDSDYEDVLVDLRCDVAGVKRWVKSRLTKVGATYSQTYELADAAIRIEWNGNNITLFNDTAGNMLVNFTSIMIYKD